MPIINSVEKTFNIFEFEDYKAFLLQKGLPNGHYSHGHKNLNNWAKRLGYKSPSSLSMILSGERFPSEEMIKKINKDLKLSTREGKYLKLLVELAKTKKNGGDYTPIQEELNKFGTEVNSYKIDLKQFSTISEWYYLAIKQLISTPTFIEDEQWIYRRLRKKVSIGQIKIAIKDLEELNIIGRNESGKLVVLKHGLITSNDISSSAIKKHHAGMIELAKLALIEQEVKERQINSTTLKIKTEDISDAKRYIFEFIKDFASRFNTNNSDNIHQLNVQFFELTKEIQQ